MASDLADRLPRHLSLRELRVFVSVLQHRSFRKAAASLHVTQPAVTKAIAGLEDLLGIKLFDRTAKGVELTVHGATFASHATAVFDELRNAARQMEIVSSGVTGSLVVGVVPLPAKTFLPRAIDALTRDHRHVFISVVEAREGELAERLRKREVDIAIVRENQFPLTDDMRAELLFEESLCVLASRSHPLARRPRVTWDELLRERWVMPPQDSYFMPVVRRAFDHLNVPVPRNVVEAASIHVQYAMVLHGSMLSFGSRPAKIPENARELLVRLPVKLPAITTTIGAVTLRERARKPLADRLVETIRAQAEDS
ncbi:MAG: LysR family transcriptional regulator [Burkholderiales bacterium]